MTRDTRAQDFDEVARSEVGGIRTGFVIALYHQGQVEFFESFGTPGLEIEQALSPDHIFPFPALTEVLVGAIAQTLSTSGIVDPEAPISAYLPELSPKLGNVRLSQLLSHTSGLDDAVIPEGQDWPTALERLNDRALFTEPGVVYSRSRYSFPLAVRAIERAAGRPFPELAAQTILNPLRMSRTTFDLEQATELGLTPGLGMNDEPSSPFQEVHPTAEQNGLPVVFTNALDALRFLATWIGGGIGGTPPWASFLSGMQESEPGQHTSGPLSTSATPNDTGFRSGVRIGWYRGHLRVVRTSTASGFGAGFHLFPESNTVLLTWGIGRIPGRTTTLILGRITDALGPGKETPDQVLERTLAALNLPDSLRSPVDPSPPEEDPIPYHEKGWAGVYLNGEYMVELRPAESGLIYFTGLEEADVRPGSGGILDVVRPDGIRIARFRLLVDREGRRYVLQGDKAFRHQDDPVR